MFCGSLERDLGQFAIARRCLEELQLLVTHRTGDEVGWHSGDRRIEVADDGVVVAPGVLHRVFDRRELSLKISETASGL